MRLRKVQKNSKEVEHLPILILKLSILIAYSGFIVWGLRTNWCGVGLAGAIFAILASSSIFAAWKIIERTFQISEDHERERKALEYAISLPGTELIRRFYKKKLEKLNIKIEKNKKELN